MSKTYVIQWKSKINGRAGRGTKHFSLEEAERLANELNVEYPNIHHEVLDRECAERKSMESAAENSQGTFESLESENDRESIETHAFPE
jgi:hypothetical protein